MFDRMSTDTAGPPPRPPSLRTGGDVAASASPPAGVDRIGSFAVDEAVDRDGVTLRLSGELDLVTAPRVERQALDLFARGFQRIVLDLAGIEFVDSTGLRMMLRLQMHAEEQDGLFEIARPSSAAHRLLEVTGMQARFPLADASAAERPRRNGSNPR
jgi:anti-anti-sigma factor